jgi:hypothetical protein
LKIYHYRNRAYDPQTGSFLQPDPLGYADSMNLYEYVRSNPTNLTDPWGLWTYEGMYASFGRKYGEKGGLLLKLAAEQGYVPVKRDYLLRDWYYESDGTLGIASKWSDWSGSWPPRIWEDSDETAAAQLYHALKDKYDRLTGRFARCLCKFNMTYPSLRQVGDDASGFFEQAGMDSLGRETIRMEAEASLFGSYMQNEVVSEAKWALAAFIGGKVAGKAIDALDDCIDARRFARATDNAAPTVKATNSGRQPVMVGQAGERAVGLRGAKTRISIDGRIRVPDHLTRTTLVEVKNSKYLSYTRQLRDYADYARRTGKTFELYVRPTTQLSGPLQDAIRRGEIILREIPSH